MYNCGATAHSEWPRAPARTPDRETDAEAGRTARREHQAVTTIERPTIDQRIMATLSQDAGPHPGGGRSLRSRTHQPAAPLARGPRNGRESVRQRRAHGHDTRTIPRRPDRRLAVRREPPRPLASSRRARRSTRCWRSLPARAAPTTRPVTFLLDEVLEFRTFERFPGLRRALPELLAVVASSPNRFVLTSRYTARTERALAGASPQFVVVPMPALSRDELKRMLAGALRRTPAAAPGPGRKASRLSV